MPVLIDYIIKLSICLSVVYLFYHLFLRRLTFYNWNRGYLLGYTVLSFVIPVINIMPELQKKQLDQNALMQWIPVVGYKTVVEKPTFLEALSFWDWLLVAVFAGSLVLLVRFFIKFYSFSKLNHYGL